MTTRENRYSYDTDKKMQLLKLVDTEGKPLGLITWFPVHCTSMNNTNRLISGDNKGYASYLFEKLMNPDALPGKACTWNTLSESLMWPTHTIIPFQGRFVAAFVNANEGDVSPNTLGPKCVDTGLRCDVATSTCGGQVSFPLISSSHLSSTSWDLDLLPVLTHLPSSYLFRLRIWGRRTVDNDKGFLHRFRDLYVC